MVAFSYSEFGRALEASDLVLCNHLQFYQVLAFRCPFRVCRSGSICKNHTLSVSCQKLEDAEAVLDYYSSHTRRVIE